MDLFKKFFEDFSGGTLIVGFQHLFVMFGATVLVPLITGLNVGVALFAAGLGTLIFHFITKMKVPVFLGSSFAFIPPVMVIAESYGGLPAALGGVAIAGVGYIVVSYLFRFISTETFHKLLPPHVSGAIIILIGLSLAPTAVENASENWGIAALTFAFGVFIKLFFERRKPFLSTLPVLSALVFGYLISILVGIADFSSVTSASWIGVPEFTLPTFNLQAIAIAVPVVIVTIVEHFGDVLAIGKVTEKDYIKDPGISRTLLGDGVATIASTLIGGPANTTYSENTGTIALTGVKKPVVMRIAALFAMVIAFIPKFTQLISSIPTPVIGGISILLFGMIAAIGIKNMVDAEVNLMDTRKLVVVAAMLVIGLGGAEFNFGEFSLSGLGLAAIVGIAMNAVINIKDFRPTGG